MRSRKFADAVDCRLPSAIACERSYSSRRSAPAQNPAFIVAVNDQGMELRLKLLAEPQTNCSSSSRVSEPISLQRRAVQREFDDARL